MLEVLLGELVNKPGVRLSVLTFPSSLEEGSPHTLIAHLFSYCFHPSRNKVIIGIRLCKRILDLSKLRSKRRNPPC